jgi:cyclophilin family peptidyl-prolyl cis-trans isomerase
VAKELRVKHFAFLAIGAGIVFANIAAAAPPYTPSQSTPKVVIETIVGDITIELFPVQAPITVNNFLQYVNSSFYDGLMIHRSTNYTTFKIIQGGGYYFKAGSIYHKSEGLRPPIINESYNGLSNLRATVAMARTPDPNSATSEFYINVTDNPFLDRNYPGGDGYGYCVFGQVISGMAVVDQIQQLSILPNPDPNDGYPYYESYGQKYPVNVYRQQVRVCVSPSGNDTTGLGSVDSPLKTIQKGIDVVNEPGHVVPAPATYTGAGNVDLDFKGKAITVRAIEPYDENTVTKTVIDCQGSSANKHRGFYFHTGEDANSVVQGLTIMNGYQTLGGGIRCDSSPTIKNCAIINNAASSLGGGIYCYNSDAVIANCTISANTAITKGGALCCDYGSSPTLANSILWNNSAPSGGEIAITSSGVASTLAVSYSDVRGGQTGIYKESGCSANWGIGNLDINPSFVDAANNDYHLQSRQRQWKDANGWMQGTRTSVCIDAGNPGSGLGYESDQPTNVRIDMGSYGGTTKASIAPTDWRLRADIDNDGATNGVDFAWFAHFWKNHGSEIAADLDRNGIVDMTDVQLFTEDWVRPAGVLSATEADFNGDDIVNCRDFAILAKEWLQVGTYKTSDINGDRIVNIYDLDLLAEDWLR